MSKLERSALVAQIIRAALAVVDLIIRATTT